MQANGIADGLEGSHNTAGAVVIDPGWFFRATTVTTLVGGTMFLMWLGEQITAARRRQRHLADHLRGHRRQSSRRRRAALRAVPYGLDLAGLLAFFLVLAAWRCRAIVFFERAQRRLLIQYPKRQVGNRMFQGDTSHLPLKLNTSGVIPPIFASSLLLLPGTMAKFSQDSAPAGGTRPCALGRGQPLYLFFYAALIVFFAFFYTAIVFNPERHGRQSEASSPASFRASARASDGRLHRLRADPHHRGRRALPGGRLRLARV